MAASKMPLMPLPIVCQVKRSMQALKLLSALQTSLLSAGMYGQSTVRLVDLKTGDVIKEHAMDPSDFGEGLTKLGDTCVPLLRRTPLCCALPAPS